MAPPARLLLAALAATGFAPQVAPAPQRIRGVNLGGWLVLERWITPSIFKDGWDDDGWGFSSYNPDSVAADQWNFCTRLGPEECSKRLEAHWDSWVTEADVATLADAGITHLRVPMGYWIMGDVQEGEPYVTGDLQYLMRLGAWAGRYQMQVWVDLHAAPGSQNGFDNSGRYGNATWALDSVNVDRSVQVLGDFAQHVSDEGYGDIFTGVGLLNEPKTGSNLMTLTDFYERAYAAVRTHLPDAAVFVGDSFNPSDFNWFWAHGAPKVESPREGATTPNPLAQATAGRAFLDTHIYHVFTPALRELEPADQIHRVCNGEKDWIDQCCWDDGKPTELGRIVGEWTAAFDQAPSEELENLPLTDLTPARRSFLKDFVKAQMVLYEQPETKKGALVESLEITGWFFWNFKMELEQYREWNYLEGLRRGWIPKLPKDRTDKRLASQLFGSCENIHAGVVANAKNLEGVVNPYPPPQPTDDDVTPIAPDAPIPDVPTAAYTMLWVVTSLGLLGAALIGIAMYKYGLLPFER